MNKIKSTKGKVRDFLGMTLDFSNPGKLSVDMKKYVGEMIEYISADLNNYTSKTSSGDWLLKREKLQKLNEKMKQEFYTMT